jgi:hypothetical protein
MIRTEGYRERQKIKTEEQAKRKANSMGSREPRIDWENDSVME